MSPHPTIPAPEAGLTRRRLLAAVSRATAGVWLGGVGLAGCGGGSDAGPDAAAASADPADRKRGLGGVDSGGTGMPSYFSAALDAVQPLMAAGVSFDTTASQVLDADGNSFALDALASGMTCRIDASALRSVNGQPSASAATVRVVDQLLGAVEAVDLAARSVTVLGQRVVSTATTRYGRGLPTGLASLQPGQLVQVWGEGTGLPGQLVATRLELAAATDRRVVRGVLSALDRSRGEAVIGSLRFSVPTDDAAIVEPGLLPGQVVRARWRSASGGGLGALESLRNDGLMLPAGREVELHGRVTRVDGPLRIAVDGVELDLSRASTVQGLRWLAPGARAEVHGRTDPSGMLVADELTIEAPELLEFAGTITQVDLAARRFVVQGRTVGWSDDTVFEGGNLRLMTLRRRVAVTGRWNADRSAVVAVRIHLEA